MIAYRAAAAFLAALLFVPSGVAQDLPHQRRAGASFERYISPDGEITRRALDLLPERERQLFERVDDGHRVTYRLKGAQAAEDRLGPLSDALGGGWDLFDGGFGLLRGGTLWDMTTGADGTVYVGGRFSELPDGTPSVGVATLVDGQWTSPGGGLPFEGFAEVLALDLLPDGRVVAAGNFNGILGNVAVWDGSAWSQLGAGLSGYVESLAVGPDGTLYAVGGFLSTADGAVTLNHVAAFDGLAWGPVGQGVTEPPLDVEVLTDGTVVIGGHDMSDAGTGDPIPKVARWTGTSWVGFGDPVYIGVNGNGLLAGDDGRLYLAGGIELSDGTGGGIAVWDGTEWAVLNSFDDGPLAIRNTGNASMLEHDGFLYLTGLIYFGELDYQNLGLLSRLDLDTGQWTYTVGLDGLPAAANAMTLSGGLIVLGGRRILVGVGNDPVVATFDGLAITSTEVVPGDYRPGIVRAFARDSEGRLIVAGEFTSSFDRSIPLGGVARWSGSAWEAMGEGFPYGVTSVASDRDEVYAAAGTEGVFRWTGDTWTRLGERLPIVRSLALAPDGTLYAGGTIEIDGQRAHVARWDGQAWSRLGDLAGEGVDVVAVGLDGTVYVGGAYINGGLGSPIDAVAAWDGSAWVPLGPGLRRAAPFVPFVNDLDIDPDGRLVAGGRFDGAGAVDLNGIGVWDGNAWSALGEGFDFTVAGVEGGPDGKVFAGGFFNFTGSRYIGNTALWDGERWDRIGGTQFSFATLTADFGEGDRIAVGGMFDSVGGVGPAGGIAEYLGVPTPDFVVTDVAVDPVTIPHGGQVRVQAQVGNLGAGSAAPSIAEVRLGDSEEGPSPSDPRLTTVQVPWLDAGETYALDVDVVIPPESAPGAYVLWVEANADGAVSQRPEEEANDAASAPITVVEPPTPDLVPSALAVSPSPAAPGATVSVSFDVSNLGEGAAAASVATLSLSPAADGPTGADVRLAEVAVPPLAPLGTAALDVDVVVPESTPEQTYTVRLVADAEGTAGQSPEDRDDDTATTTLEVAIPPTPDLYVAELDATPQTAESGGSVVVSFTLANGGLAEAAASTATVHLGVSPEGPTESDVLLASIDVDAIAGAATRDRSVVVSLPADLPEGTYALRVTADADATAGQADEDRGNDAASVSLDVVAPPTPNLVPLSLTVGVEAAGAGEVVEVSFQVDNQGPAEALASSATLRLSASADGATEADPLLATVQVPALAPGAGADRSLDVTLPLDLPNGAYYLWLTVDSGATAGQADEDRADDETFALLGLNTATEGTDGPPTQPTLAGPRPNPASRSAVVRFGTPHVGPVRVLLLDLAGRLVDVLYDGPVVSGWHDVQVDLGDLAGGAYVVQFRQGDIVETHLLSVVR